MVKAKTKEKVSNQKRGKPIFLMAIPFLAINIAVIFFLGYYIFKALLDEPADAKGALFKQVIEQRYELLAKSTLENIVLEARLFASLPEIREIALSSDLEQKQQKEKELAEGLAVTHGLRVLPLSQKKVEPNSNPPVSNVVLDLLRKVSTESMLYPEVIVKDEENILVVIVPVLSGEEHIANLLLGFGIEKVQRFMKTQEVAGFMELVQQFGRNRQLVASIGDKARKQVVESRSVIIKGTPWRVEVWPSENEVVDFREGHLQYILVVGLIAVTTLICFVLTLIWLNKALEKDARRLTKTLVNVIGKRFEVMDKAFSLRIFFDIASPLSRASKDLHASSEPSQGAAPRRRRRAALSDKSEASAPAPAPAASKASARQREDQEPSSDVVALASEPNDNPSASPAETNDAPEVVTTPNLEQPLEFGVEHSTTIDASIFRAYDIRGVVGESLTEEIVEEIGRAIGSEAYERGEQTVIVARDGRLSGPTLLEHLKRGLMDSGRDVVDIGEVPTPVLYFATNRLDSRSGVMLTGSHNPANYNGLKMVIAGESLYGEGVQKIYQRLDSGDLMSGKGSEKQIDIANDYIEHIVNDIALAQPLKVVVDCGNGVCGAMVPKLLEALGCEVIPMYCEIDGNFPNHHPDPSKPDNLKELIQAVLDNEADVGLAFDGDGDRLGVIASDGKIIWPDRQLMLYAVDVLSRNPGADVIYDVKCTKHLPQVISSHGGRPLMWKTGHSLIKAKMKETGALLAGECSGHMFFKERWFGFDDALYTAARLLEILGNDFRTSAQVFETLPEGVSTPELNVALGDDEKFAFVESFASSASFDGAEVTSIDGVRVDFNDGWGLVRASNTTPNLVIRFEADDESALTRIKSDFKEKMLAVNPNLNLPF